jgi:hypothetical protein
MSAAEVAWRLEDEAKKWSWLPQQVTSGVGGGPWAGRWPGLAPPLPVLSRTPRFVATLPPGALRNVPGEARASLLVAADEVMAGRWALLGVARTDLEDPDWFFDPVTGKRAPSAAYCFAVDHRSPAVTGNVKQVWELSRMQHLTVLAAAFALSGDERYAERAARHLRSWWAHNPFLSGVHWTSGIEVGLRLIAWAWVRRLLEGWPGAPDLFEENPAALAQIWWHQRYLARFRSRGSSANNHVIAEAAGQLIAGLAFAWFDESEKWAGAAGALLEKELANNTFATGVNREMAFEYHGFVAELGLLAAVEADRAGQSLGDQTWQVLCRMLDVVAATVDTKLHPPRQGDGDDGKGLVLGPSTGNRWASLLGIGAEIFGAAPWWPGIEPDASSTLIASLAHKRPGLERPGRRPCQFADAGLTIMRAVTSDDREIWCRCDAGPHGFLSIAAHAHADALSLEVRHQGTEILADPGTYCYQGEPLWRSYFRGTLGHNTIELAGQDQSSSGGPTLWARHARSRLLSLGYDEDGETNMWSADHDGYSVLDPPASHRRTVRLVKQEHRVEIDDVVETAGHFSMRIAFHLGPGVHPEMRGENSVELSWAADDGGRSRASLELAPGPRWTLWTGSVDPVLGWYSPHFGEKQPTTSVIGEGACSGGCELKTVLQFLR